MQVSLHHGPEVFQIADHGDRPLCGVLEGIINVQAGYISRNLPLDQQHSAV